MEHNPCTNNQTKKGCYSFNLDYKGDERDEMQIYIDVIKYHLSDRHRDTHTLNYEIKAIMRRNAGSVLQPAMPLTHVAAI